MGAINRTTYNGSNSQNYQEFASPGVDEEDIEEYKSNEIQEDDDEYNYRGRGKQYIVDDLDQDEYENLRGAARSSGKNSKRPSYNN